jgi:agmatinase
MSPEEVSGFDINGPGIAGQLFGLPFTPETARLVVVPVPWEATVTYKSGTAIAPEAILAASRQIDFFFREIPDAWKMGVAMLPVPSEIREESNRLRDLIGLYHAVTVVSEEQRSVIADKINEASETLNIYVKNICANYLSLGKMVGVVGGDHSTPLGLLRALREKHSSFGILQIDAHADLRKAYEGFQHSHASIMYNAMKIAGVTRLVQVGTRDLCEEEFQLINRSMGRVKTFFDDDLKASLTNAKKSWEELCEQIIRELPGKVYISFDIDGLDPKLCPHTGTPVPGGLEFYQAASLIKELTYSGRTIIGFDLNEVGHDEWDANVGARILWLLCNWMGVSNGQLTASPRARDEKRKR